MNPKYVELLVKEIGIPVALMTAEMVTGLVTLYYSKKIDAKNWEITKEKMLLEFEHEARMAIIKEIELERIKSEERIAKAKYQAEVDQTKAKLKAEKEEADAARKHEKDLAAYEAKRIAEVEHLTNRLANTAATAFKPKLIYGGYKDE